MIIAKRKNHTQEDNTNKKGKQEYKLVQHVIARG